MDDKELYLLEPVLGFPYVYDQISSWRLESVGLICLTRPSLQMEGGSITIGTHKRMNLVIQHGDIFTYSVLDKSTLSAFFSLPAISSTLSRLPTFSWKCSVHSQRLMKGITKERVHQGEGVSPLTLLLINSGQCQDQNFLGSLYGREKRSIRTFLTAVNWPSWKLHTTTSLATPCQRDPDEEFWLM